MGEADRPRDSMRRRPRRADRPRPTQTRGTAGTPLPWPTLPPSPLLPLSLPPCLCLCLGPHQGPLGNRVLELHRKRLAPLEELEGLGGLAAAQGILHVWNRASIACGQAAEGAHTC